MLLPGWRTRRKIIVIESDDWGTIRMPDTETFAALSKNNPGIKKDSMEGIDSLESNEDLSALFDLLSSVKDAKGNPAVLTANTIVANPDFNKIAESNFLEYFYENFTDTLKRYPSRDKVMEFITQGISEGVYKPQFHGREHVNIRQWLSSLQKGNTELLHAFKYSTFGVSLNEKVSKRNNLMAAFDFEDYTEMKEQKNNISDGLKIFENIFGFNSTSFIATSYIWDSDIEENLNECGIKYLQGIPYQYIPDPGAEWYKRKFHYTGQKNKFNQVYLVRNAYFEPSMIKGIDTVGECLKRIELAFKWRKPAIIGSHRVNFIGSIEESNRTNNLKLLKKLLLNIVKKWPDIEFMTSDQLGDLISSS